MNETQIFIQAKLWRNWTIDYLKSVPTENLDRIPSGHNNTIRWNVGHILVGWDHSIFTILAKDRQLPDSYHTLFPRGSYPDSNIEKLPHINELIKLLETQVSAIEEACSGKLDHKLDNPFLGMTTLGEMVLFHINHESLHMGVIKSMNQILLNSTQSQST